MYKSYLSMLPGAWSESSTLEMTEFHWGLDLAAVSYSSNSNSVVYKANEGLVNNFIGVLEEPNSLSFLSGSLSILRLFLQIPKLR